VPMTTRIDALRLTARHPVGARVDVFVDPNDPATSALEPASAGNLVAQSVFAAVFCIIAAVLVAHALAGEVLKTAKGVPLFAFALPAVCLAIALMGIFGYAQGRRRAAESARWPTAPGTVTTSAVLEERVEDTDRDDKSFVRTITRYRLDLRYAYKVGARDFVGTDAGVGWEAVYGDRGAAEKVAARYAPGQHVSVYYDPQKPANALLEPDNRSGTLAPLVFSAVFGAGGALMLFVFTSVSFQ